MKNLNVALKNKKFKVKAMSIILGLMTMFYCFNFSYVKVNAVEQVAYETQDNEEILSEVRAVLKKYYIDSISEEVLASKSISEMISKLNDPYSSYFTKEEYDDFVNGIDNKFVGIGINVEVVQEGIKVTNVISGSPAEEVGIKANDIILKANNINLAGILAEEAVKYIKGEEGTSVIISIKRGNNFLEYQVVRKVINAPTVEWEVINNIGYISVNSFGVKTGNEFSDALKSLSLKDVSAYIVDLRYNPGGYIYSALDIGGHFIGNNTISLIEDKEKNIETYKGFYHGNTIDKPIIFLINEYSASASELLAAAIKDYKKAFFIGKTTYGKGVGQTMYGLSDGAMLKLTTIRFYSPLGNTINHVGVAPDFEVHDENMNFLEVAYLLLSGVSADRGNNNDYMKVTISGNTFYINLKEARKPEHWKAYNYIINNVLKDNISIGSEDKWVSYDSINPEEKTGLIYPNSKVLNNISKVKTDKEYTITFNKIVDIKSIAKEDIELVNSMTGDRIPYKIINTSNSSKVNLYLEKEIQEGLYYLVVNSNNIMDEKGKKLSKRTVTTVVIN